MTEWYLFFTFYNRVDIFAKILYFSQMNLINSLRFKLEKITLEPTVCKITYGSFHFIVSGSIYVDCIRHFAEDGLHTVTPTVDE